MTLPSAQVSPIALRPTHHHYTPTLHVPGPPNGVTETCSLALDQEHVSEVLPLRVDQLSAGEQQTKRG